MEEEYEVVISGVGGKFPEADQIDELKDKLMQKENLVTVDDRRWKVGINGTPPAMGKVREVEKFDTTFFGIHRRLSNFMDPQNRHILERSYEAIYDSGYNPNSLKGGNIGVYIAAALNETEYYLITQKIRDGFGIVGLSRAMLPNRISYFFNFKGPSTFVQNGWESGMEVLTTAVRHIKEGRIEAALVGVPNLHMFAPVALNSVTMGCLTFDENTKSFDADADGYVQGEAVVMLFLQRKQDARRVYATVVHSNSSVFGLRFIPFTHYTEDFIVSFLKEFYEECQIDPTTISFVEADGSAVKDKDIAELKALSKIIGKNKEGGLLVGSIKSNLGHTEAASSLVGLVKALIVLESGIIPSNIHFNKPNPQVSSKVKIVSEHTQLDGDLVAVNGLSFTGGVGHALLRQNPKHKQNSAEKVDDLPRLLTLSARNITGVKSVINKVSSMSLDYEYVSLINDIHQVDIPGHMYRMYVVHQGETANHVSEFAEVDTKESPVWFLFSGMGSQWPGMGRELLKIGVFADSIAKCDKILAPKGINIYNILTDNSPKIFDDILNCFVGITCIQVALVDLLFAIGIKPDGLIGHSVGELGCAYADGCFTAEQTILASYGRGVASVETELIPGAMAAIGIGYKEIKDQLPPELEIACHNSSSSCTVSGPQEDVKTFVDKLTKDGIFAKIVKSANIAYHCKHINPIAPKLLSYLKEIIPERKLRSSKWISSSVPFEKWGTPLAQYNSPEYHTNNVLSPVLFEEASKYVPNNAICIEIAPHGLLQAIVRRSLKGCIHIPLTQRNSPDSVTFLLSAAGRMYLNKLQPNVNKLFSSVTYPVSRGTPSLAGLVTWDHSENWAYGEKYRTVLTHNEEKIDFDLQNKKFKEICAYKIHNNITIPVFALLYFVWEKLIKITGKKILDTPVVFDDIWVHEMLAVSQFSSVSLLVSVQQVSGQFEVAMIDQDTDEAKALISGYCSVLPDDYVDPQRETLQVLQSDSTYLQITPSDLYDIFNAHGYSFTGGFQNVKGLYIGEKDIVGKVEWNGSWLSFFEGLAQVAIYFQLERCSEQTLYVPLHIQKLQIYPKEFLNHSQKKEVTVCMDSTLNTIFCDGIKLVGLSLKPIINDSYCSDLIVESPVFVPHGTTSFKNVNEFLSVCIQIAQNNKPGNCKSLLLKHYKAPAKVLVIDTSGEEILYKKEFCTDVEIVRSSSFNQLIDDKDEVCLTVATLEAIGQSEGLVKLMNGFYLIQSKSQFCPDHCNNFNEFSTVLEQKFDTVYLTLIIKKEDKYVTYIDGTGLSKNDILSHIKVAVKSCINDNDVVAVIMNNVCLLSSNSIIKMIAKEKYGPQIKFIFNVDESSSVDNMSLQLCQNQLKKGLSVNFYKDGMWGSIIMADSLGNRTDHVISVPTSCDKEIEFKYIGLNTNDFNYGSALKTDPSLGPLEFSGFLKRSDKVMGFVSWDPAQGKADLEPDNDFIWRVPEGWSLEDAATVPFSFSVAFYSLTLLMKLKPHESVLIHSGFSTLGQSAIAVALQTGSTVYTTVNTERQKQQVLTQFPKLNSDKILQLQNDWFDDQILSLTSGRGVNVIFCTLAGESFNASLRCLATSGRIMQLNKADMELGHKMGMSVFLRNTSLYAFDTDNLFMAPIEWKKAINKAVKEGIENGIIKPLKKQVFQLHSKYGEAIKEIFNSDGDSKILLSVEEQRNKSINKPISIEHNKTFIVVGSGYGLWLDILEILAKYGAYNLVAVFDSDHGVTGSYSHKINQLISLYNVIIHTSSVYQLSSAQIAEEFLQNILKFGPIDSVFITLAEKDVHFIRNLDVACRKLTPDVKFICLMGAGEDICETRLDDGFHASAIIPSSLNIHPRLIGSCLESVFVQSLQNKIFVVSETFGNKNEDYDSCLKLLESYLPSSSSELDLLSSSLREKFGFTEVNSRCPHLADLQYVVPLFVIPGLTNDSVTPLVQQLMAPVFCAELPSVIESATEAAKNLFASLLQIQPKGPYNIIGETWNGSIAIELARLLEESGQKVLLILLSATPHTFQMMTRSLGSCSSFKFSKRILSVLLKLQPGVVDSMMGFTDNELTWNDVLSTFLLKKFGESDSEEKIRLQLSLDALHNRILSTLYYYNSSLKQSSIAVIQSKHSLKLGSDLDKLYGDNVTVYLMEEADHSKMLSSVKTANLINELINFTF